MRAFFCLALAPALLAGCGGGGFGDEAPPTKGSVLGAGRTLASLNDKANPGYATPQSVQVTGVQVVFIDNYDETRSGAIGNIFLRDFTAAPSPYQGILAFQSSFSPPSFRTSVGDVIDASGQFVEFQPNVDFLKKDRPGWTTPEISANLELRFDAPYVAPTPAEINILDFLEYEKGRPWLSMLVVARNVKIISNLSEDSSSRASLSMDVGPGVSLTLVPTITNELFDLKSYVEEIKQERNLSTFEGVELESVTGLVTLFDRFHIAPRGPADIVLKPAQ